ncbi:preprotein translocase subunit SecA [Pseudoalteromonas aurantia]|uniref:Preprotein translocase subunit SecA n=2 Tax=Pseudoalteromonas aurantia TaxID=43654 RepID=A0A5S3V9U8_9GAMM|nr:preprotein translocase subunit SecA [Pseudoalteromonas aurantia]TMO68685.1 preprotein translocase subunit SecA [Pseudoalteromonas aurantia]TMO71696.1 preprotein translocase subunit SecA [Pseudoalteromonas aurantia]
MRSRYSAYCVKDAEYILNTYASSQRSMHTTADILQFANDVNFIKLDIIDAHSDNEDNYVEFKAHYLVDDKHYQLHERSRFVLEDKKWKYLGGDLFESPVVKIGRNDPCPCNSGKKFKKCHG